jgi:regulatory protein
MRKRLQEKGIKGKLAEEVMDELEKFHYIDDEKFAESYINDRVNLRPAGRFLIKMELKSRGVREPTIDRKLEELISDEQELEMAQALVKKRINGLHPQESEKDRMKLMNYLKARGFSAGTISQAIKNEIELAQDKNSKSQ